MAYVSSERLHLQLHICQYQGLGLGLGVFFKEHMSRSSNVLFS